MIPFTFCNNNAEPQSAYLLRIELGKSYPIPSQPELDMLASKAFKFFDKDGSFALGQLSYIASCVGNYVTYQRMGINEGPYLFEEGDEIFIVKKDLLSDEAYFIPSREIFKHLFGIDVPSVLCSVVWLKERGNDSLHLYTDEEHVLTLIGTHSRKPSTVAMKKYRKEILDKLQDEFWVLDNATKTNFTLPQNDVKLLFPTLRDNFSIQREAQERKVVVDTLPSITCPYIRWKFEDGKQFFALAELEGIETPIKGVRSFRGNESYFEQLVNWYYTLALME